MNKIGLFVFGGLAMIILLGYWFFSQSKPQNQEGVKPTPVLKKSDQNMKKNKKYSIKEVTKHNKESDCWLIINNQVYDVTKFITTHPGGRAILEGCGKQATNLYQTRPMGSNTPHSKKANNLLKQYYLGDLK